MIELSFLPFQARFLSFNPNTVDHYRPKQVKNVFARAETVRKMLAPDDPMLFLRPKRLRPTGASLN